MTEADFMYSANFPSLGEGVINKAYETVSVMFSGVQQLWACLPDPLRTSKRNLCMQLLTAWYLLDFYPGAAVGVAGNGGIPLTSKSIGGVSVSFAQTEAQEGISQLSSNVFGHKALAMIQSAPERFGLYV